MVRNKPLVSKPETILLSIMIMYDGWLRTGTKLQSLLDVCVCAYVYIYIYIYICIYAHYWYMHVLGPGHGGVASCCLGLLIKWWQGRVAGQLHLHGPALVCSTVNTEFSTISCPLISLLLKLILNLLGSYVIILCQSLQRQRDVSSFIPVTIALESQ